MERDDEKEITTDAIGRRFKGDMMIVTDVETGADILLCDLAFPENDKKKYKVF